MTDKSPPLAAGRELDAKIAETLFGWTDCKPGEELVDGEICGPMEVLGVGYGTAPTKEIPKWNRIKLIPPYSTNWEAAGEVIKALCARGHSVTMNFHTAVGQCQVDDHPSCYAATGPEAICLAALSALGGRADG